MMEKLLGLPINASDQGGEIDRLIVWVHILMVVLFIGWGAFFARPTALLVAVTGSSGCHSTGAPATLLM